MTNEILNNEERKDTNHETEKKENARTSTRSGRELVRSWADSISAWWYTC